MPAASASSMAGSSPRTSQRLPLAGGRRSRNGTWWPGAADRRAGLPGRHNVSNVLAAVAVASCSASRPDAIRRAAAAFTGVEHRLEPVAVVDGVRFVNDSQGTQPDAGRGGPARVPRPVVLIAGGRDKGIDLARSRRSLPSGPSRAVLIGESGPTLETLFHEAGLAHTERALARSGPCAQPTRWRASAGRPARSATVLLSPAAQLRHVRGLRGPRAGLQAGRGRAGRVPSRRGDR
jgi:UDP-N-acetylmuramoylalanine-D-glutamate ligase